jgi:cell cycle sensor histidine kinase DivJ
VSTYEAASQAAAPRPLEERLLAAMAGWAAAVTLAALLAWRFGAPAEGAAAAGALALAPALITALVAKRWGESWAATAALWAWVAFATVAAAETGGAASPAVAAFLIAPALASWTQTRPRIAETAAFSGMGFALAALGGGFEPVTIGQAQGLLAALLAAVSVVYAGVLISAAPTPVSAAVGGADGLRLDAAGRATAPGSLTGLGAVQPGDHLIERLAARVSDADRQAVGDAFARARLGETAVAAVRVEGATVELTLRPDGQSVRVTGADVTRWAAALKESEDARLAAAAASESKSRAIADLSHELRTPLTHILGFAEIMEHGLFGPMPEKYASYPGLIRSSGAHLLALVNDMLDLSRIEAGRHELEIERFDARAIAAEVVEAGQPTAQKKGISVTLEAPDAALDVDADPRALRQILLNTVSNGVKFTPKGGAVQLALRAEGGDLVCETIDTGPGIPPDERAALGERFVRGASGEAAPGAGLGLSLVRALAELHGGALSFHEAPGGGALVRVRLPVLAGR